MSNRREIIEIALIPEGSDIESVQQKFDKSGALCYKISTSLLFLREQDARRSCTASAFLTNSREILHESLLGVS
jgi:hypothetical protein